MTGDEGLGAANLRADGGAKRCAVCDEPLDGETVTAAQGEVHEECQVHDDGVDLLPDGGRVEGMDRCEMPDCDGMPDEEVVAVRESGDLLYMCSHCLNEDGWREVVEVLDQ